MASQTLYEKEDILDQNIFGNAKFSYNGNALFFSSFSLSGIQKNEDIWDDNTNFVKSSTEIFYSLYDRRNWISEYSRIKKAIPQELIRMLKSEPERGGGTYKMSSSILNERECIFFFSSNYDIFPGQMSYVNHRGPYVAHLGYIG